MKFREAVCFDDVLLEPKYSTIETRQDINLDTTINDLKFSTPIISSPMDTVTEVSMVKSILKFGGLPILHRYNTIKEQCGLVFEICDFLEQTSNNNINKISASVGVGKDAMHRVEALYNTGVRIFCLDIAHGHHNLMERCLKSIREKYGSSVTIIAGNVATASGFSDLSEWGADAIRVGIGGGSICSTRIQTGHGIPTLQSVFDCAHIDGAKLIADGGIKTSGDIVKALAAGADFVMLGSMLAGTDESPGEVFESNEGKRYKVYRGMASPEAQIAWRKEVRSLEGISTTIPYKGPVLDVLTKLTKNIKSGLSYSGARNLTEFQAKASFIKQTTLGLKESKTHILTR